MRLIYEVSVISRQLGHRRDLLPTSALLFTLEGCPTNSNQHTRNDENQQETIASLAHGHWLMRSLLAGKERILSTLPSDYSSS